MTPGLGTTAHLNADMVKALAHPLRARLLAVLRVHGPSNSSQLAQRLGTNSGATSYHLRRLAKVGLVEDDPDRGNGRERWWRAAHRSHSWRETEHLKDPDTKAAADWLIRYAHRQYGRRVEDWLDARTEWPVAWRDAADQSDYGIVVTASQLAELNERIKDLVDEYQAASDPNDDDAERVTVLYYSFPLAAVDL